ncbi:NAD-dependent epimerase/dehydratase family protein [Nonomuraea sp. KC401]|uniref:NAD(P)H-binding protein n=1 Tax=unclassified Nonomuraea TaxID=2593643 RepID=UPI0010FD8BB1|nr:MULTISPECIES: NAD(P)H-binding protein [unclassified Nonomuraea]NBE91976.1 NAD(P)H-binding protein [Nonomuraea sp. K271]TLF74186.1 NAD-dependent epimerase/dehydratase family protein [Nonomuraea sp. KC401]
MNVLVIGGTGTTGSRVAAQLGEQGAAVRVATRSPAAGDPAHVRFDWNDPDTHRTAVAGVDGIYLIAPAGSLDPAPLVRSFLTGAVDTGVRRVVLLSASALPEDAPGIGALPRTVRATVPEWAILRPSWFMQNFTGDHPVAHGIRAGGEIVTATGDGRVGFVDAVDIAAVAVRALLDAEPHNRDHLITGPEALGYAEAAAVITDVTGLLVRHRPVDTAAMTERFVAAGLPPAYAGMLAALDEDIRRGAEDRVTGTVADVTGRPARSFAEFVTEHRAAFAAPGHADAGVTARR